MPQQAKAFVGEEDAVKTVAGKFELAGLPAGKELVRVSHPDYLFALSEEFELGAAETDLPPIVLRRGATVRGTVYDGVGAPRASATIDFHDKDGYGGRYDQEAGLLASVVTDDAGRYEVRHLPEQLCYVHLAEEWDQAGVVRSAILPVASKDQTLDLGGPGGIHGRLLVNGVPQANIRVQLGGENPNFGVFKAYARSNSQGEFAFGRPPAGRRVLWYQPEGRQSNWIRAGEATFPASTAAGESIDLGDVDPRCGTIMATVTGLPAAEAATSRVLLLSIDPVWLLINEVGNPVSRDAPDAPFIFRDVPPGAHEAAIVRSDGVMLRLPLEVRGGDEPQTVTLDWPASTGSLTANIAADFCDAQGCSPPKLRSVDGRVFAYLQPRRDGQPLKIEGLPAGDYYLTDQDVRDARQYLLLAVNSGATTTIDVNGSTFAPERPSLGITEIHWYGAGGTPLTGVEGTLRNAAVATGLRITKRDAEWSIVGPPGDYSASVEFPGYPSKNISVRIMPPGPDGRITDHIRTDCWLGE